jgi:hypothetical protein
MVVVTCSVDFWNARHFAAALVCSRHGGEGEVLPY